MTDHPSDKHSPEPPVPEPSRSPTDQPIDPNLSSSTDSVGQNDEPSGHVTVYQRQTLQFTGPLPPPEVLHGFKEIDSTFPERIVVMAERQSEHRQSMERTSLDAQIQRSHSDVVTQRIGQSLGFLIACGFLGGAVFAAYIGHPTLAGVLGSTTVVSLVVIFVTGRGSHRQSTSKESNDGLERS